MNRPVARGKRLTDWRLRRVATSGLIVDPMVRDEEQEAARELLELRELLALLIVELEKPIKALSEADRRALLDLARRALYGEV